MYEVLKNSRTVHLSIPAILKESWKQPEIGKQQNLHGSSKHFSQADEENKSSYNLIKTKIQFVFDYMWGCNQIPAAHMDRLRVSICCK